jgi:hypothetical protein
MKKIFFTCDKSKNKASQNLEESLNRKGSRPFFNALAQFH